MPSSLSLASIATQKYSVAYWRYTTRVPGSNHLLPSTKFERPSVRALSTLKRSFTTCCCCSAVRWL